MTLQALGGVNLPCGWYRIRGQPPSTGGQVHTHISHHRQSPSCYPQCHQQLFCSVLDTPHVQAIKNWQMLACFFCSLLINSPHGINSQWISTIDNKIADNISQLKKHSDNNSSPAFNYTILKQTYLELRHCSFFQIQPELILLIWDIVLTKNGPITKRARP